MAVVAFLASALLAGCAQKAGPRTAVVKLGAGTLTCEVADTEEARQRGLQGHPQLREGEGMIFVSQGQPRRVGIVMKTVPYALDVLFVDARLRVARIATLKPVPQKPNAVESPGPVRYVIEAPAGWAAKHHVGRAARVAFPDGAP